MNYQQEDVAPEYSLIRAVEREFQETALDLTFDYTEIAFDALIETDAISEIPIVKTMLGVYKLGNLIREKHFIKKILSFFQEYHSGQIDSEEVEAFNKRFKTDEKYKQKVIEHVVILVDRIIEIKKSRILAHLLLAHTQGFIDWKHYTQLSFSLERLHPQGLEVLKIITANNRIPLSSLKQEQFELLASVGLAYEHRQITTQPMPDPGLSGSDVMNVLSNNPINSRHNQGSNPLAVTGVYFTPYLTDLGKDLCSYGLSKIGE